MTTVLQFGDGAERYVLDASAAVEYLQKTRQGLAAAGFIETARLIVPELLDAEVMSVLRRYILRGEIDEAQALTALDGLAALPVERISHRPLIPIAWRYYHNVSTYDALYVAVAQVYGATILTCDGHLSRAPASVLGVTVRNIGASGDQ